MLVAPGLCDIAMVVHNFKFQLFPLEVVLIAEANVEFDFPHWIVGAS
jgi:hypothetical protein